MARAQCVQMMDIIMLAQVVGLHTDLYTSAMHYMCNELRG